MTQYFFVDESGDPGLDGGAGSSSHFVVAMVQLPNRALLDPFKHIVGANSRNEDGLQLADMIAGAIRLYVCRFSEAFGDHPALVIDERLSLHREHPADLSSQSRTVPAGACATHYRSIGRLDTI